MRELTSDERALAEAMSDVSELAYCAGWMQDTEYEVWRLLHEGGSWGQADAEHLAPLLADVRAAFDRAGCWIVWDDEHEEQPITLGTWRSKYRAWAARHGKEDASVTDGMVVWLRETLDAAQRDAEAASGGTVVGGPGAWLPSPAGDEWEASRSEHGDEELLVALRPGLPRPPDVMSGMWGAVVSAVPDGADSDAWSPMPQFVHAARHDPAAVLRRIAADRKTLEEHKPTPADFDGICRCLVCGCYTIRPGLGPVGYQKVWPCPTIRNLAEGWGWTEETKKPDWPECMCTPSGECGRCWEKRQREAAP